VSVIFSMYSVFVNCISFYNMFFRILFNTDRNTSFA